MGHVSQQHRPSKHHPGRQRTQLSGRKRPASGLKSRRGRKAHLRRVRGTIATRPSGKGACSSSPTTSTEGTTTTCPPETGATPPDDSTRGPDFFDFTRFGVRVPAVIVSPLIPAGTVFRAPTGSSPHDHTSIIATLRARFNLGPLGKRDAVAPNLGPVLTPSDPRHDDPLTAPTAADPIPQPGSAQIGLAPGSFLEAKPIAAAKLPIPSKPINNPEQTVAALSTAAKEYTFIQDRLRAWEAAGKTLAKYITALLSASSAGAALAGNCNLLVELRDSNPRFDLRRYRLNCRFISSRSDSVQLVTCGFVFGSWRRQEGVHTPTAASRRELAQPAPARRSQHPAGGRGGKAWSAQSAVLLVMAGQARHSYAGRSTRSARC